MGVFLIGGIVLFGVGLFLIAGPNKLFSHSLDIYAYFTNVGGLNTGAQVQVSGLAAGTVSDIRVAGQDPPRFRVTLAIKPKLASLVRQNSVASISSQGMVGDEMVEIDPGQYQGAECSKGCTIQSKEPKNLSDLIDQASGVMQTLNSTLASAGQVANRADQALTTFDERGRGGTTGPEHLRETVANAQRAANNVAEDAEALKHNFFLRGFFKHRGFYSLQQMSAEEYRKSDFVKEKKSIRDWLPANELFRRTKSGVELTEQGRHALDQAMANILPHLPNKPLMIEGYSSEGPEAERYRESEARATAVRDYLMSRFQLKPEFTGTMPLSDHPPEQTGKTTWDGICLVLVT